MGRPFMDYFVYYRRNPQLGPPILMWHWKRQSQQKSLFVSISLRRYPIFARRKNPACAVSSRNVLAFSRARAQAAEADGARARNRTAFFENVYEHEQE
jgi:hypothetical protein